jgi:hypothetical protein
MASDPSLETLALDQKRWSITADALKKSIGMAQWTVLVLLIAGALLETLAAQIAAKSTPAEVVGYAGAAALAIVAVVRQWRLGRERVQAWVLARAASESLKHEMFLYRANAGPYSGNDAVDVLYDRRDQILKKADPVRKYTVEPKKEDVTVPGPLDENGYIAERIDRQIEFFNERSTKYSKLQGIIGGLEFLLAIAAALLGVASTTTGNQRIGPWVAVITTVTGAFAAHALAQRYEQLTVNYRATADRLGGILGRWRAKHGSLPQLAEQTEAVLTEESQAWIAGADEMMKDSGPPPPQVAPAAEKP